MIGMVSSSIFFSLSGGPLRIIVGQAIAHSPLLNIRNGRVDWQSQDLDGDRPSEMAALDRSEESIQRTDPKR